MPTETNHTITQVIIITLIFLLAAAFLILYVLLYNKRKKKHDEEKEKLKAEFDEELIRTQLEVQEQTLQTIGSEIHDNVGQLLSLTRLTLSTVNIPDQPLKAQEKVSASLDLLTTSIKELRQMASLLHAQNLLAAGLENAVKKELDWITQSDRYTITYEVIGLQEKKADPQKEVIAFRLIQELFNNIIKHAEASAIRVSFAYQPQAIHIEISDNGIGFDVSEAIKNPQGLGISNLFKRARVIGGLLTLESDKVKGTKAVLIIPYQT